MSDHGFVLGPGEGRLIDRIAERLSVQRTGPVPEGHL
jgi:hypothetical protein